MQWIVIWGVSALAACLLAGLLAGIKNRDWSSWMAWSFIFPPLVIVLLLMPSNKGPRPRRPSLDEEERQSLGH